MNPQIDAAIITCTDDVYAVLVCIPIFYNHAMNPIYFLNIPYRPLKILFFLMQADLKFSLK